MVTADKASELAGVHALVVDDDQDTLDILQTALHSAGARVTAVSSADKAFEVLSRMIPHVIVCDLRMPEQDGLAFGQRLQTVPALRSIPILAVSGFDQFYGRRQLHDAGFIGILRKPVAPSELVLAVAALADAGSLKVRDHEGTQPTHSGSAFP